MVSPFIFILLFMATTATFIVAQQSISKTIQQKDQTCSQSMFLCSSTQQCIPRSWVCDQEMDCQDGEDEKNCDNPQPQCGEQEYACRTTQHGVRTEQANPWLSHLSGGSLFTHTCIPLTWKCDGEPDCLEKDDEEYCPVIKCDNKHFECKSFDSSVTSCIPAEWVCDGQTDCLDMKDELNCTSKSQNQCDTNTEFRCNDGQCIYKSWRCDGDHDCMDRSDEEKCHEDTCENIDKLKCKSTNFCIPKNWKCDGEPDCPDHSDETECQLNDLHLVHAMNCSSSEFRCTNGAQCISKFWICDGEEDCFDGSDEKDCRKGQCKERQKECKNGQCIAENLWCDGTDDCQDKSDEKNCTKLPSKNITCDSITEYTCPEEPLKCIKYDILCNGKSTQNDCTNSVCDKQIMNCNAAIDNSCICRKMEKGGNLCTCPNGFKSLNGEICQDINECEQFGTCDQICINKPGGYQCDCYPGYKLSINGLMMEKSVPHKCRALGPDPLLLLANRAAIRQYNVYTNKYHPLISKLESAVALDYWHENNTLVWSDVSKEQIVICKGIIGLGNQDMFESINKMCTEDSPNVVKIKENVTTPDGLAIDWVHGLLFWTDTGTDTINVYDFNTKQRTVLIDKDNLDEPRAIAVDPAAGLIFWTDWGENARIERAGMDGKNRNIIVKGDSIRWPNGLAVDILDKRLYWADAKTKQISSCDYWGNDIRTVLHSHQHLRHPFSLAVFEEKLYWTDWDQEGVLSVNKFGGGDVKKLMHGVTGPMTVRVYHKQAQPKHKNKCQYNNCQQICLPKAMFKTASKEQEVTLRELPFSCACASGFQVSLGNSSLCVNELNPTQALSNLAVNSFEHFKNDEHFGPFTYIFGVFVICAAIILVYSYQRKRPRHFAALHFDNPIYRRTVEDLDADLENISDNTLGPISILPRGGSSNFNQQNNSNHPSSKLVLSSVPVQDQQQINPGTLINMNNPDEYAY